MKHYCEQKKRAEEITSPAGQASYGYFEHWMKARKFRSQTREAFMASKYYRSFMRFANLVITAGISKPLKYIELMVEHGITPELWHRDACYKIYLDWVDRLSDPFEQVKDSIELLMDLAEKEGVDYRKILEHLGSQKILSLILQRKLSPWFLLHSSAMQRLLKTLDPSELKSFDQAVNIGAWVDRLQEQQQLRQDIRAIISELEL